MTIPQALHKCAVPDCPCEIPTSLLMCREHWGIVTLAVQRRVWVAWRALQREVTMDTVRAHREAKEAAIAAVLARRERIEAMHAGDGE